MKNVEKQLIIKFLRKECSSEEAYRVMEWMHSEDFDQELLHEIETDLKLKLNGNGFDESDSLQRILKEILLRDDLERVEEQRKVKPFYPGPKKSGSISVYLRVAAAVIFILMATYFIAREIDVYEEPLAEVTAQKVHKENSKGRKSTIFLADGTVVNLNADSKIEYYESFSDTSRVVYLKGEAFFDVAKDSLRPFQVITSFIQVTALGTSFNVQSFADNPVTAVALADGKVEVKSVNSEERVFLEPGQKVKFKKYHRHFSRLTPYSPKAEFGWKEGILYFKKAGMDEVIRDLERWYGITIILTNKPDQSWKYTGEFRGQSLKSVMESLSFSQNFKYKIKHKEVFIEF